MKRLLVGFDPKAEYPNVNYTADPDEYGEDLIAGRFSEFRFGTNIQAETPFFSRAAMAARNCCIVFEECALLFQRGQDVEPWLQPVIYTGREVAVDVVLVGQRYTSIPLSVRSQATRIITFFQQDADDRKAIAAIIGREHFEDIARLEPLECFDWEAGKVSRYRLAAPAPVPSP